MQLVNNTVYQPVGDAILLENAWRNLLIRNNILWVGAGYGIRAADSSQPGLSSDDNLFFQGTDPNSHVGFWGVNHDVGGQPAFDSF